MQIVELALNVSVLIELTNISCSFKLNYLEQNRIILQFVWHVVTNPVLYIIIYIVSHSKHTKCQNLLRSITFCMQRISSYNNYYNIISYEWRYIFLNNICIYVSLLYFCKNQFLLIIWLMVAESRAHNIIFETYEHCKHRNGDD